MRGSRNAIVYDAIRACDADGEIHADELANIRRMANILGTSDETLDAIREVYEEEKRIKKKRLQLVFPEGSPF